MPSASTVAKAIGRFLATTVLALAGFYLVIGLCIVYFKLTGALVDGSPMYMDQMTPTNGQLLIFLGISLGVVIGSLLARKAWR